MNYDLIWGELREERCIIRWDRRKAGANNLVSPHKAPKFVATNVLHLTLGPEFG
ncbi:MAG: hypothetical protein V4524_04095 [Patescibacteria group bacterium]